VQAIVLVGGEGTRLRPLTLTTPKPALRLVDRPFIEYACDWLGRHGVGEVVMACGFRAEDLRAALGDETASGLRVTYLEEPEPLGTAGPIRLALDRGLLDERFLVLNGDLLADLDLSLLQRVHSERGARATIGVHPVADPGPYGLVRHGGDGAVTEFVEKPDPAEIDTDEVNAGAYVLERSVAEAIPAGRAVSIERETFPGLVGDGLYAERLEGYWLDIGTPERFLEAAGDILERRVSTVAGERLDRDGMLIEDGAEVAGTLIAPAVVGAGSRLEPGAVAGPQTAIAPECRLGRDAIVGASLVGAACVLGARARVEDSILADGVVVRDGAHIASGTVIGEGAEIGPGAEVEAGSRIDPGAEVDT
jgi:mannose-1-phosphate guanylyltransferase